MTKSSGDRFNPVVQELQQFAFSQQSSITIMRVLGYGLLLLALFDIIELFVPPNFMNPAWEFQTIGALVERVPVPLIGLVLVFFGELHSRTQWELPILKFLSWLTLLFGILFFLLIPLGLTNTVRLNNQSVAQIKTVSTQQVSQAEQLEQQVSKASPEQIGNFLKSQGRQVDGKNPDELKNQLLSEVSKAKEQIKNQAEATQSLRGINLIKTSAKWNLGALVAGTLFISIWKGTRWARN
ncbi:HpsJ-like protein, cyanoexosortase A-associated [Mastigocladopsis repens]|uniref:HpsJ-like protein, cyanoexosortase A-associated n=1 Tax=Mastigocladopsis repens TaxID=221287 RepID=UPI000372F4CF|nr:HpsJ family protein [Mastigocladopsis repens]